MDLNKKTLEITIATLGIVVVFAAIAYSYIRSQDFSIQIEEIADTVPKNCETETETQECPARGPILSAPYFINGVIQGYRVYPGEDAELFESTGLEFDDLVTAVGGQPLINVELMNELLASLSNGQPVQVTVNRQDAPLVINLEVARSEYSASEDDDIACPVGTKPAGETVPEVREAWCELYTDEGVKQHGPYQAWYPNGVLSTKGQFHEGQHVGLWFGWYASGAKQGEVVYEDGEIASEIYWTEDGLETDSLESPPSE